MSLARPLRLSGVGDINNSIAEADVILLPAPTARQNDSRLGRIVTLENIGEPPHEVTSEYGNRVIYCWGTQQTPIVPDHIYDPTPTKSSHFPARGGTSFFIAELPGNSEARMNNGVSAFGFIHAGVACSTTFQQAFQQRWRRLICDPVQREYNGSRRQLSQLRL